jgi:hypothetical protein
VPSTLSCPKIFRTNIVFIVQILEEKRIRFLNSNKKGVDEMGKNVTEAKVNEFGSRLNTIGAKLDEMLTTGLSTREAQKNLSIRSQQIFQHFKKLKDRGHMVERTEPVYRIKKGSGKELKKATEKPDKKRK